MGSKADKTNTDPEKMEKLIALCRRRGFVYGSSEIYGGLAGAWDYGPLGAELKRNVKDHWWRTMTQLRDDIVGLDASILMNRDVWKASGHEETFTDPVVQDPLTGKRFRADQIEPADGTLLTFTGAKLTEPEAAVHDAFSVLADDPGKLEKARKSAKAYYAKHCFGGADAKSVELLDEKQEPVTCTTIYSPETGCRLGEPVDVNLMFTTTCGLDYKTYLRPETAQGIFVNFKNVLETSRVKLPFGIAQIGKAFRNEINPRQFTFRSREFEQMEVEFFVRPEDGLAWTDRWLEDRLCWYETIGLPREQIRVLDVPDTDRAFYSKKTYDLEYAFPFGVSELEGIAYRTDYDLSQHIQESGKNLEYFDPETNEKLVPHVVEPSAGVDRTVLALLCEAFDEEEITNEKGKTETRTVLRFAPCIAPIKAAVLPLLKNKPELVEKAKAVRETLRPYLNTFYDEAGAIGRRYRRMDEAGTPYCVTIDFETIEGLKEATEVTKPDGTKETLAAGALDTVTLRHRDSMAQERVKIADLLGCLKL
ncbi:MAG: glycine--tRNA ligase [Verrucomicrobiota bacterium]